MMIMSRGGNGSAATAVKHALLMLLLASSLLAGDNKEASAFSPPLQRLYRTGPPGAVVTTTSSSSSSSSSSALFANSENIRAAMEATERYGIHSPEARLAWEVVEEFDAGSNDSAAYESDPRRPGLSPEDLDRAYRDVGRSMELMRSNLADGVDDDQRRRLLLDVAAELRSIRLGPPAKRPAPRIAGLWDSKLKARAVTQQFGVDSAEARLAWEEVEEIASSGLERAVVGGGGVDNGDRADLVQAAQALEALEELERFLGRSENNHHYPSAGDDPSDGIGDDGNPYNNNNNYYDNGGGGTYH